MTKIVGSTRYTAPEVLNRKYTQLCDIWSIGVITYILLCGYFPFDADENFEVYRKIKSGTIIFPPDEWDHISKAGKDFVTTLMTYDFNRRPSAQEAMKHYWIQKELQLHPDPIQEERKLSRKQVSSADKNVLQVLCGSHVWWTPHVSVMG